MVGGIATSRPTTSSFTRSQFQKQSCSLFFPPPHSPTHHARTHELSPSVPASLPHPAIRRAVEGSAESGVLIGAVGAVLQSVAEIGGAPHTPHA